MPERSSVRGGVFILWIEDESLNEPLLQNSRETNRQIEAIQRQIAQPRPYRFVLRRLPDKND